MSKVKFYKEIGSIAGPYSPNSFYAIRTGSGFDLKLSDLTGQVLHDINSLKKENLDFLEARLKTYVQSRGQGLLTNGYGLLKDNTNFSNFTFDPSDAVAGYGMFKTGVVSFDKAIDEFIAVNPERTYEFSFYAKSSKVGTNNLTYAYVSCYDLDQEIILPYHTPIENFKAVDVNVAAKTITIDPVDRDRFNTWFDRFRLTTQPLAISNPDYSSKTGFKYPYNTYTRDMYCSMFQYRNTAYDASTGVWSKIPFAATGTSLKPGMSLAICHAGGTYTYLFSQSFVRTGQVISINTELANHPLPAVWTRYVARFRAGALVRAGTALIKVGWLLNRSDNGGNESALSAIEFKEVG